VADRERVSRDSRDREPSPRFRTASLMKDSILSFAVRLRALQRSLARSLVQTGYPFCLSSSLQISSWISNNSDFALMEARRAAVPSRAKD
jgi:hypothetical protein